MSNEFKDLFGDWEPGDESFGPEGRNMPGEPENLQPRELEEKEVRVLGVYEHAASGAGSSPQTFVLMQDPRARKVFIYIGRFEAVAISMAIEGEVTERPMTHDLLKIFLDKLGATVDRVIIDDIWHETFYAKITVVHEGRSFDIDCRPSDAIAIALRAKAPIFMAESVIKVSEQEI